MQKQKFISEMGLMTDLGLTLQFNNFVSKAYLKAKKCKKIATNCKFLQYFLVIRIFFYYICRRYRARTWVSARVINDVENNRKHLIENT